MKGSRPVVGKRHWILEDSRHGTVKGVAANGLVLVLFDTGGSKWVNWNQLEDEKN